MGGGRGVPRGGGEGGLAPPPPPKLSKCHDLGEGSMLFMLGKSSPINVYRSTT